MTPRWKIRREWLNPGDYRWSLFFDNHWVGSYFVWENALTHVDNWYHDQTLRSEP